MAGSLHIDGPVRSALTLVLLTSTSGCILSPEINERPSLEIVPDSTDLIYRSLDPNYRVRMHAEENDPDGDNLTYRWTVQSCTGGKFDCDSKYAESTERSFAFPVPPRRADGVTPATHIRILLDGKDSWGAAAKPQQESVIALSNHPPDIPIVSAQAEYGFAPDFPIDVYFKVGDEDDGPGTSELTWTVYSPPTQPAYELVDLSAPSDPEDPQHLQVGKRLTPHGLGLWTIELKAKDPFGDEFSKDIMLTVEQDKPPCLAQWAPIAVQAPNALPVSDPTLFLVNRVMDSVDPWPANVGDPFRGTPTFEWSVKRNAGPRRITSATANQLAFDPALYTPGDIVEIRVEIADRNATPITCADGNPTCAVGIDATCIQRQTWRVEVR